MKVADIYALLTIKPDPASIKRASKFLDNADGQIGKSIAKMNKSLGRGLNLAAVGGFAAFTLAAKDALKFDETLTTLKIATDGALGSTEKMRQEFLNLSSASGVAKEELVAGAQAYFDLTGDAKGTTEAVRTFARVAKASATPMEDVSGAAAAMKEQFGLSAPEMEQAFSILIKGGKAGAVSLANMATLASSLGAKFKDFGSSQGLDGVASLGAMFQLVMKDSKNAAEAATNLENLFAKIKTRRAELAKIGVKVENGKTGSGQFKDITTILKLLDEAKKKNFSAFQDAFGADMQANAALDSLTKRLDVLGQFTEETRHANDVEKDLAERNRSGAERATKAWNDLKNTVARAFNPEMINGIANALSSIASTITSITNAVGGAENAIKLMVAAWVALKALNLAVFLTQLAGKLSAVAAANAAAGGGGLLGVGAIGGGLLAEAGALAGAGVAGYAAGTALDSAFGISDKINGVKDYRDPLMMARREKDRKAREASAATAAGTAPVNVTINASGTDPQGVVDIAKREIRKHTEATNRATAAAVGAPP